VSTCTDTYPGVPDKDLLEQLKTRCEVRSVEDAPNELFFDVTFQGDLVSAGSQAQAAANAGTSAR
jgi:hypothetical protein